VPTTRIKDRYVTREVPPVEKLGRWLPVGLSISTWASLTVA
jgi:hypothetical protein